MKLRATLLAVLMTATLIISACDGSVKIGASTKFRMLLIMKEIIIKYKKPIIISVSVIILQLLFGFDPKFCIINLIWLLV